jgi:hypothetical protein
MEDFGIQIAILSSLRPNGIFYGHRVHLVSIGVFSPFWYVLPKKSGNPALHSFSAWTHPSGTKMFFGLFKQSASATWDRFDESVSAEIYR